jgi:solute carrier family 25, member 44
VIASQIYVTTFELTRHMVSANTDNELVKNAVPGGLASLISQSVVVPVDIVSQRMMVHGQVTSPFGAAAPPLLSTRQVVRDILKTEGSKGLFRGYWTSIATFAPSSIVWWAVYGKVREMQLQASPDTTTHVPAQALAGAIAGCVTAITTNPLDTIRTRLQLANSSEAGALTVRGTIETLLRQSGWAGLLKGATARVIHMAPNSVLMITAYEMVKRWSLKPNLPAA